MCCWQILLLYQSINMKLQSALCITCSNNTSCNEPYAWGQTKRTLVPASWCLVYSTDCLNSFFSLYFKLFSCAWHCQTWHVGHWIVGRKDNRRKLVLLAPAALSWQIHHPLNKTIRQATKRQSYHVVSSERNPFKFSQTLAATRDSTQTPTDNYTHEQHYTYCIHLLLCWTDCIKSCNTVTAYFYEVLYKLFLCLKSCQGSHMIRISFCSKCHF